MLTVIFEHRGSLKNLESFDLDRNDLMVIFYKSCRMKEVIKL